MARPRDDRQKDLLQPALDRIIDMGSSAGAVGGADRLGLSRRALRLGVPTGPWSTWLADAAGGGPLHSQAHAQPIGGFDTLTAAACGYSRSTAVRPLRSHSSRH